MKIQYSSKYALKFSLIIIYLLFIPFIFSTTLAPRVKVQPVPRRSTEFIKTSCTATKYPRLCFNSLAVHASKIQSSPQLLTGTALNVTLSSAKTTTNMMVKLSLTHGLAPREVSAIKDCIEEMSGSVDELRMSIAEMSNVIKGNPKFKVMINDIQTWVSAALTDETTCSDGFQGNSMNGKVKAVVRARIVNVAQLTSNALALINKYALIHG